MSDGGKTGPLVEALAAAVRDDLADIASDMNALRAKIDRLGDVSGALNGLSGDCSGWSRHLESLLGEVDKTIRETPAKLTGSPIAPIVTTVDTALAERVSAARAKA